MPSSDALPCPQRASQRAIMTPPEFPWYALFFFLTHPLPEPAFVTGVWGPSLLSYPEG